jgi:hypothetical protein
MIGALAAMALAAMALAAATGCGRLEATVRYMTGGVQETVAYDSATFQLAKGKKVQILLFRRTAALIGTADADFEYTFFELPEQDHYGWLRADNVPVYRWVRQGGHDHLWLGATGQESLEATDRAGDHRHFDFRVTMEPLRDTPGGAYFLTGNIKLIDDPVRTQGLINQYGDWLVSLLGLKPPESPAQKVKPPVGGGLRPSGKKPKKPAKL